MVQPLRILDAQPWAWWIVAAAAVLGLVSMWGRGRSWIDRVAGWGFGTWIGLILATSFVPVDGVWAWGRPIGQCAVNDWLPLGPTAWFGGSAAAAGMWLFAIPGALAMISDTRHRATWLMVTVAAPFVVEGGQLLLPAAQRACDSTDLVNALLGVVLGAAAGLVLVIPLEPLRARQLRASRRRARKVEGQEPEQLDERPLAGMLR